MKTLKNLMMAGTSVLLMMSSSLSAVEPEEIKNFFQTNNEPFLQSDLNELIDQFKDRTNDQWDIFKNVVTSLSQGMTPQDRSGLILTLAATSEEIRDHPKFIPTVHDLSIEDNLYSLKCVVDLLKRTPEGFLENPLIISILTTSFTKIDLLSDFESNAPLTDFISKFRDILEKTLLDDGINSLLMRPEFASSSDDNRFAILKELRTITNTSAFKESIDQMMGELFSRSFKDDGINSLLMRPEIVSSSHDNKFAIFEELNNITNFSAFKESIDQMMVGLFSGSFKFGSSALDSGLVNQQPDDLIDPSSIASSSQPSFVKPDANEGEASVPRSLGSSQPMEEE